MTTPSSPASTDEAGGPSSGKTGERWKTALKRAVQFSFLFFLLKGIAWLVVGWLAWQGLT